MTCRFTGFAFVALLMVGLLGTQAACASDADVGTEAWLRYEYRTKLKDDLRGFFSLRYEEQLDSGKLLGDWRRWDLKGGVSYDLSKRLRLEGGIGGYHTWLPDVKDIFEIRLWQAMTVDWPEIKAFARYVLHNRFMLEERFKNTTSGMNLRGRYRLSMSIPINRYTVEPGAFYMPLAAEFFADLSNDQDQLFADQARYTIGLGYMFNKTWNLQFSYTRKDLRDSNGSNLYTSANVYELKLNTSVRIADYLKSR